tara:strand:- start:184 stop:411 length:228 start_codon:yes stop_codon:yes gene_type:complete
LRKGKRIINKQENSKIHKSLNFLCFLKTQTTKKFDSFIGRLTIKHQEKKKKKTNQENKVDHAYYLSGRPRPGNEV